MSAPAAEIFGQALQSARAAADYAGVHAGEGIMKAARTRRTVQRVLAATAPALIVVLTLFVWLVFRSIDGTNTAGVQMPAMGLQHRVSYWWPFLIGEALGIAALVWSYLAVFVGLLFSTRRPRWPGLSGRRVNDLHRHLALTTIALILSHALFVALGAMNGAMNARAVHFNQAFLPFQTSWNRWPYAFGIFSMYLAVLLGPTYYIRGRLGPRAWRAVHRLSIAIYILAVAHSLYFDDFDFHGPYRMALWAAQIPLTAMLLWRLADPIRRAALPRRRPERQAAALGARAGGLTRLAAGMASCAVLIGLGVVVVTGRIGGAPSPFHRRATHAASTSRSRTRPGMQMGNGSSMDGMSMGGMSMGGMSMGGG